MNPALAALRALRRRGSSQDGITIVEVVVAAVLLTAIAGGAALLFANGNDTSFASQRYAEAIAVADQQIETIRQEVKTSGFNALAMSAAPAALPAGFPTSSPTSSIVRDPNSFVQTQTGCGPSNQELMISGNYDNNSGPPANPLNPSSSGVLPWSGCTATTTQVGEPLEILSGYGFVTPQLTNVSVGGDPAVVDTYVTDTYVGCNSTVLSGCPATGTGSAVCSSWPTSAASTPCGDARRVIVAVVLKNQGRTDLGPTAPVIVSSIFTNSTPSNEPTSSIGFSLGVQIG